MSKIGWCGSDGGMGDTGPGDPPDAPMTVAEALAEVRKVYYCTCGALPSPTLMGALVCRACGYYRRDTSREPITHKIRSRPNANTS